MTERQAADYHPGAALRPEVRWLPSADLPAAIVAAGADVDCFEKWVI
jgi:hypothetical protein